MSVVDYQALREAQTEIATECDTMQNLANQMNSTIDANFGSGGQALDSEAGDKFKAQWEEFSQTAFPKARAELDRVINEQLKTWEASFSQAEMEIINKTKGIL